MPPVVKGERWHHAAGHSKIGCLFPVLRNELVLASIVVNSDRPRARLNGLQSLDAGIHLHYLRVRCKWVHTQVSLEAVQLGMTLPLEVGKQEEVHVSGGGAKIEWTLDAALQVRHDLGKTVKRGS